MLITRLGVALAEVRAEHLHVASQHDEVDALPLHQLIDLRLLLVLRRGV